MAPLQRGMWRYGGINSPEICRPGSCAIKAPIYARMKNILGVSAAIRCGGLSLCSPVLGQAAVVFNSRIQTLGRYAFILHYYQPNHATFPVEVFINGGRIWQGESRDLGEAAGRQKPWKVFLCWRITGGSQRNAKIA